MKTYPLLNAYGTRFGTEYVFDTEDECQEFIAENWPEGDAYSGDVWNQNVFTVGESPRRADPT